MAIAEAWEWRDDPGAASKQNTLSVSCFSAELEAELAEENGRVGFVGFARVSRLSGAPGRHGEGSALSAHLLPPVFARHRGLARGAALSGVQDTSGVCGGRTSQQHPPCPPSRWHQAEASEGWTRSGSLYERDVGGRCQSTQQWDQRAGHPRGTTTAGSGQEQRRPG